MKKLIFNGPRVKCSFKEHKHNMESLPVVEIFLDKDLVSGHNYLNTKGVNLLPFMCFIYKHAQKWPDYIKPLIKTSLF